MRDVVGRNQGNLEGIAGDMQSFLPGLGERAFGDNPLLNSANSYTTDVLGGRYLDQQNPYMHQMIGATANDVSDRVNSLFARAGSSLGSPHAQVLTRELANAENTMRYGNYAQERQNQQGAASMVPGLNQSQYAGVMPYATMAQTAGSLPYAGLGALSPIIGLAGGSGQQSGTQPGGWGNGLLGAAVGLGGAALGNPAFFTSERRLKKNIVKVGELADGLPVYDFVYRNDADNQVQRGVMVDEVEKLRPWALGPKINGIQTVNYAHIEPLKEAA